MTDKQNLKKLEIKDVIYSNVDFEGGKYTKENPYLNIFDNFIYSDDNYEYFTIDVDYDYDNQRIYNIVGVRLETEAEYTSRMEKYYAAKAMVAKNKTKEKETEKTKLLKSLKKFKNDPDVKKAISEISK